VGYPSIDEEKSFRHVMKRNTLARYLSSFLRNGAKLTLLFAILRLAVAKYGVSCGHWRHLATHTLLRSLEVLATFHRISFQLLKFIIGQGLLL
jgi:hypothetical protein